MRERKMCELKICAMLFIERTELKELKIKHQWLRVQIGELIMKTCAMLFIVQERTGLKELKMKQQWLTSMVLKGMKVDSKR
jgi:hypothetical protein